LSRKSRRAGSLELGPNGSTRPGATAMKTNGAVRWLRVSYWAGAILDALAALSMLFPALFAATNRLPDFHPGIEYRYAMGMDASLMLGWTALLLWADRKPLERKGVLLITLLPVVLGLVVNEIVAVLMKNAENACKVVAEAVARIPAARGCKCGSALAHAILTYRATVPEATRRKLGILIDKYFV